MGKAGKLAAAALREATGTAGPRGRERLAALDPADRAALRQAAAKVRDTVERTLAEGSEAR